jgi:hypothetical protein
VSGRVAHKAFDLKLEPEPEPELELELELELGLLWFPELAQLQAKRLAPDSAQEQEQEQEQAHK